MGGSFGTGDNHSTGDYTKAHSNLAPIQSKFLQFLIYPKFFDSLINNIFSPDCPGILILNAVEINSCIIRGNIFSRINNRSLLTDNFSCIFFSKAPDCLWIINKRFLPGNNFLCAIGKIFPLFFGQIKTHTQIQYIPLPRTPLRPNRLDQFIGIILFAVLSIPVWDFANKHEWQFNREIALGQA